jgi:hypothetical protein
MKDDFHELIDGGLPDEQAAEVLHLLSVDPEKRAMFSQHLRLQKNLCRNQSHAAMSSLEEGEMLGRISRVVGEPAMGTGRYARRGIVMLVVGFLVGSGAGYVGHSLVASPAHAERTAPDTVQVVKYVPATEPQVFQINRDSIVAAITDSVVNLQKRTASTTAARKATPRVTSKGSSSYNPDDPTGYHAARQLRRKRARH